MSLPPTQRFDATAEHYSENRPSYPPALVDWLIGVAGLRPGARIVDLGCGTGIATRAFAARGFDVVGVDPSERMLERARAAGGATYRRGESTATGLDAASFDLAIAAQAFHWFDIPATLAELRRILVPRGWCAAFWNLRADTPPLREYDALLRRYSTTYAKTPKPLPTIAAIEARPEVVSATKAEFPNAQRLDREGLVGRALSSSFVQHGVDERATFERELRDLFDRHQQGGEIELLHRTVAIAWQLAR
jgi:SAM-dependent methyltransferase